eukprot:9627330-Alexandrium_andersonii.AAC.1
MDAAAAPALGAAATAGSGSTRAQRQGQPRKDGRATLDAAAAPVRGGGGRCRQRQHAQRAHRATA